MTKVNNSYEREVEAYFNSLKNYKKLTKAQEKELAHKIQEGDNDALNTLVEHNLRFVVNVANGYKNSGIPFADLISEGNLGLIHAAKKFDGEKNIKFITYAVWWIKYYIKEFINQHDESSPSIDAYENYQYSGETINEEFEERLNSLNDHKTTTSDLLKCLKDRERRIIMMSFGLEGNREMTLDEISKVTDLSKERVRQIKDDAMAKIKCKVLSLPTESIHELKALF